MGDLITRKAAVSRISDLLILELKGRRIPTWNEVYNAIGDIPSVPAVPLEMISTKLGSLCKPCIFHIGCPYKSFDCDSCNTSDAWEKAIRKWMEEQDAQKEN